VEVLVLLIKEVNLMLLLGEGLDHPVARDIFLGPGVQNRQPLPLIGVIGPDLPGVGIGNAEQQREDAGEEQAHFLDLLELHDAEAERGQEQQQAVDAGRDGEREHCVADLAQKAERQNTRKLKQIVRKDASFGSTEQENTK